MSEFDTLKAIVLSIDGLIFQLLKNENNITFLTYLLDNGIDPDSKDSEGNTPMHIAAKLGYLDILKLLITRGANKNSINKKKETPLFLAVECNQEEILDELLLNNVDHTCKNIRKQTALLRAVQKDYSNLVLKLVNKGAEIDTTDTWKNSPLHYSSLTGNYTLTNYLIDSYVNTQPEPLKATKKTEFINKIDDNGETALHLSSRKGTSKITKLLINNGANPNVPNYNFFTPLHISSEKGDLEITQILLNNNASTTTRDIQGFTPLRRAVLNGKESILDELLSRGVTDVESTDKSGNSALHDAHTKGLDSIVTKLVNAGANTERKNKNGKKPSQYSKRLKK